MLLYRRRIFFCKSKELISYILQCLMALFQYAKSFTLEETTLHNPPCRKCSIRIKRLILISIHLLKNRSLHKIPWLGYNHRPHLRSIILESHWSVVSKHQRLLMLKRSILLRHVTNEFKSFWCPASLKRSSLFRRVE